MERLVEYVVTIFACLFLTFHYAVAVIDVITIRIYSRSNGCFFKSKCFPKINFGCLGRKNNCDRLK